MHDAAGTDRDGLEFVGLARHEFLCLDEARLQVWLLNEQAPRFAVRHDEDDHQRDRCGERHGCAMIRAAGFMGIPYAGEGNQTEGYAMGLAASASATAYLRHSHINAPAGSNLRAAGTATDNKSAAVT